MNDSPKKTRTTTQWEKYVHLGLGWIEDRGGGLERYQHGICAAHAGMGLDVTAWVQSRCEISAALSYPVVSFASPTEKRSQKLNKLRAMASSRFKQADFTFVTHHASVSGPLSHLARTVPHVVHFQGPWAAEAAVEGAPWWKTWLQSAQERKAYHSADRVITLSEAFRQLLIERFAIRPEVVHVVPGAIDSRAADPGISRVDARRRMRWPEDRPIALTIRRLVRRVGVDVLIEAVAQLLSVQRNSDLLVMIGGTGPLQEQLQKRIHNLGLEEHVRLLGFVPDDQLSTAYRAADLSIVPTQSLEGFGLVTLESLATGTPAMVTPIGSLPEVLTELSSSLVLAGSGVDDICAGLRAFFNGTMTVPDEHACRDYVRTRYDWSVIAPRVLDVYRLASV